jgi:ankyrin repeat protein
MPSVLSKIANNNDTNNEEIDRSIILKRLIKNDPTQINVRNSNGYTPLMLLCVNFPHEYDNIKLLLENGGCPNIPDNNGVLPYVYLKNKGYEIQCRLLLEYGSKIKNRNVKKKVKKLKIKSFNKIK